MLRRHGVAGGVGKIIEYYGPGLACLSAMDRHVIANMGAELGATTTVFPSDHAVERFLVSQGRGGDWRELSADADATYDEHDEIDLSMLEPLIACPIALTTWCRYARWRAARFTRPISAPPPTQACGILPLQR